MVVVYMLGRVELVLVGSDCQENLRGRCGELDARVET